MIAAQPARLTRRSMRGYATRSWGSSRRFPTRSISSVKIPIPTVAGVAALAPCSRSHLPMIRILKSAVQDRFPGAPLLILTGIARLRLPGLVRRP